jgi:glycosyltransferase involved in cell wall biosynthesis
MGEIDVFVFPTRYRNEAEPLVVLEALSHGCPVISYARGCIAELLGCDGGLAIPVGEDFVRHTLGILEAWRSEGTAFNNRSASARRRFSELQAQSAIAFQELLERFGITDHEGSA